MELAKMLSPMEAFDISGDAVSVITFSIIYHVIKNKQLPIS
jgi:hypothetical protein